MTAFDNCKRFLSIPLLLLFAGQPGTFAQGKPGSGKGYGNASYNIASRGSFMRNWLIAGPLPVAADTVEPSEIIQESSFLKDSLTPFTITKDMVTAPLTVHQQQFTWQPVSSGNDIIKLDSLFKATDFKYAYALAEIQAPAAAELMLATGSDDGIKIWLNGRLIHSNWLGRGTVKDNDLVPLQLIKGSNQLLIKVQNMKGGWSFVARLLDKRALTAQMINAASAGNVEKLNLLMAGGADINAINASGMSAIAAAKISGHDDLVKQLKAKGAKDIPVPSAGAIADDLYTGLKTGETPGVAVLVAKDGNVLYSKGFGYADIKNKKLVSPNTRFRIGSVTKQFTAAAILRLQENKRLSVDDKLSKFIPDFPRGDSVTIHQLLTHTSGIHSYTNNDDFLDKVSRPITPDSLINLIKQGKYDFDPGTQMQYNNSGYFILGYLIGKLSGKSYANYLKDNFFEPLGMNHTGIYTTGIQLDDEAKGYAKKNENWEEALNWDMSWAGGAGAIYSTVGDLLKWNQALYGGKILSKESLAAAETPVVLKNGEPTPMRYGYGLVLSEYRGQHIIGHSGGLHGFLTQLIYLPESKLSVVMFTNTAEPEVNFDPNKIAEAFLWDKMDKQAANVETAEKPKDLQQFTGRFDLPNVGLMTVTTMDAKLYAQLTGQGKYEIFPKSADEFFWKVVDARLKFTRDSNGVVNMATLYQNGQELRFKKLKEETIIQLDAAQLDAFTGKYKLNKDINVSIFKEKDQFFAQPTGESRLELLAVSPTEFVVREINAHVVFIRDATGKVNTMKLHMNGTDNILPRIE